jgi:hypothetical protein
MNRILLFGLGTLLLQSACEPEYKKNFREHQQNKASQNDRNNDVKANAEETSQNLLRSQISIQMSSIEFPVDSEDFLVFNFTIENRSTKTIYAAQFDVTVSDIYGDKLYTIPGSYEIGVLGAKAITRNTPRSHYFIVLSDKYPEIADSKLDNLKLTSQIEKIAFKDKSVLYFFPGD